MASDGALINGSSTENESIFIPPGKPAPALLLIIFIAYWLVAALDALIISIHSPPVVPSAEMYSARFGACCLTFHTVVPVEAVDAFLNVTKFLVEVSEELLYKYRRLPVVIALPVIDRPKPLVNADALILIAVPVEVEGVISSAGALAFWSIKTAESAASCWILNTLVFTAAALLLCMLTNCLEPVSAELDSSCISLPVVRALALVTFITLPVVVAGEFIFIQWLEVASESITKALELAFISMKIPLFAASCLTAKAVVLTAAAFWFRMKTKSLAPVSALFDTALIILPVVKKLDELQSRTLPVVI